MTFAESYRLRMALLAAGHIPVPMVGGKPVMVLREAPTEGYIRSWAQTHPDSTTGIVFASFGLVAEVTAVPDKRERDRLRKEAQRRAAGAPPREEWLKAHSLMQNKPWAQEGIHMATWYRRRQKAAMCTVRSSGA
jgi:hypothetical protein